MRLHLAATAIIVAGLSGHAALAQDGVSPVYAITYLEVAPNSAAEARQLILTYSADARKAAGAVHIEALQRIGYASHFALIEQWQSQKSKDDYAAGAATAAFARRWLRSGLRLATNASMRRSRSAPLCRRHPMRWRS